MPVYYAQQSPFLGIWKILEPWQDMLEMFQDKMLYADEVLKIKSEKRKCEWLAIRLLLKHLTGFEIPVGYKDNGSPFLIGSHFHISISHTKGYAALILSKNPNPGIDIEYRSERALKLCTKFLNRIELEHLNLLHQNHKPDLNPETLATLCWCAKETVFKALQENEVDFIQHFHVAPFIFSAQGAVCLKETKTHRQETYPIHYQVTDEFVITWKE